jgi:integrase
VYLRPTLLKCEYCQGQDGKEKGIYKTLQDAREKAQWIKNKDRDIAIVSVLLGTGMRISELTNLNIDDYNDYNQTFTVIRKGGYKDSVSFSSWVLKYLNIYLDKRLNNKGIDRDNKALFVSFYRGKNGRITPHSIEQMVKKTSLTYGKPTTPHKFRHSLATEIYDKTKNEVLVASQLGQTTTSATKLYTHILDEDKKKALDSI